MTTPKTPKTHAQPSAVKKVVDYIAHEIYAGNLVSGDRLPTEAELCSMLQISRTPVREATNIWNRRLFCCTKQGSGTFVVNPKTFPFPCP